VAAAVVAAVAAAAAAAIGAAAAAESAWPWHDPVGVHGAVAGGGEGGRW
jgi:Spy/CpxP family protein refolding chaperone